MFTPPSCVTCQVSHVRCHMSGVRCHVSCVKYRVSHFFFFKVMELVGWGSGINGPTLSSENLFTHRLWCKTLIETIQWWAILGFCLQDWDTRNTSFDIVTRIKTFGILVLILGLQMRLLDYWCRFKGLNDIDIILKIEKKTFKHLIISLWLKTNYIS